jgi:hypothetical protein
MVNDMHELCQFYVKREKVNATFENNQNSNLEEYSSRFEEKRMGKQSSRNRSFSSFLVHQDAYNGFESFSMSVNNGGKSFSGQIGQHKSTRQQSLAQNTSNLSHASSMQSLSNFCTVNELEKSMSYIERTAKKLLPILVEVKKRMIPDKKGKIAGKDGNSKSKSNFKKSTQDHISDDDDDILIDLKQKDGKNLKPTQFDMKNILGYLNQGENLQTLSIGGIMQL